VALIGRKVRARAIAECRYCQVRRNKHGEQKSASDLGGRGERRTRLGQEVAFARYRRTAKAVAAVAVQSHMNIAAQWVDHTGPADRAFLATVPPKETQIVLERKGCVGLYPFYSVDVRADGEIRLRGPGECLEGVPTCWVLISARRLHHAYTERQASNI